MLPKKLRVPIQGFPKNAKVVFSDVNITIKEAKNRLSNDRLAVLINKQVSKSSTKRNFLKRKFLSFSQETLLKKEIGKDLLIILKPPIIKLTNKELNQKLQNYGRLI